MQFLLDLLGVEPLDGCTLALALEGFGQDPVLARQITHHAVINVAGVVKIVDAGVGGLEFVGKFVLHLITEGRVEVLAAGGRVGLPVLLRVKGVSIKELEGVAAEAVVRLRVVAFGGMGAGISGQPSLQINLVSGLGVVLVHAHGQEGHIDSSV